MGNAQGGDKEGKCGYRVLGVQPNSPASKVGLVSFFDFIVAADGECLFRFWNKCRDVLQSAHTRAPAGLSKSLLVSAFHGRTRTPPCQ